MTSGAIDELFAQTLVGEYDDDAPWKAVHELQTIGTLEVFDKAVEWCGSTDAIKRARGADVIAQLGADLPGRAFPEDSFIVIASLMKGEADMRALSSEIHALGHIGNPRAVRMLAPFRSHPNAEIRFALACTLGSFADDPMAIDALVQLTRDEDEDVREWATFGIGALCKVDSPAIREALLARLDDSFEDARQEAIVGLARLKDERVLPALLTGLDEPEPLDVIVEATLDMLGVSEFREEWTGAKCASELRRKFTH